MHFQKSDYKLPLNVVVAPQKGEPHPEAKNSMNLYQVGNARKDRTEYQTFGQQNPDRDRLPKKGKWFPCKKHSHAARDCPTSKVSCSYQSVNRKHMCKVKTASSSVKSDVDTSYLPIIRLLTYNTRAIISVCQKILNAVEIKINGHNIYILIDSYTINGELISANFCLHNKFQQKIWMPKA